MTRILIVEDHALVREAMLQSLRREGDLQCDEAPSAEAALERLEHDAEWDLLLVDLMLSKMSGFSLLAVLGKRFPELPVIIVSALNDPATVRRAIQGGALGFVHKSSTGAEVLRAVRAVLAGEIFLPDELAPPPGPKKQSFAAKFGLSPAQMRVVELLSQGMSNREIAENLGLSEGTIKVHMSHILKALHAGNRSQVILAFKRHSEARG